MIKKPVTFPRLNVRKLFDGHWYHWLIKSLKNFQVKGNRTGLFDTKKIDGKLQSQQNKKKTYCNLKFLQTKHSEVLVSIKNKIFNGISELFWRFWQFQNSRTRLSRLNNLKSWMKTTTWKFKLEISIHKFNNAAH